MAWVNFGGAQARRCGAAYDHSRKSGDSDLEGCDLLERLDGDAELRRGGAR